MGRYRLLVNTDDARLSAVDLGTHSQLLYSMEGERITEAQLGAQQRLSTITELYVQEHSDDGATSGHLLFL